MTAFIFKAWMAGHAWETTDRRQALTDIQKPQKSKLNIFKQVISSAACFLE